MTNLRPDKNVHKILISTSSRFIGEYENEDILISHAWHGLDDIRKKVSNYENPLCRNSFVITFLEDPIEMEPRAHLRDFTYVGDLICMYLTVLFGKRFDNHGRIESGGFYYLPQNKYADSVCISKLPQNNHSPRKDLEIPLNLCEISRIERLLLDDSLEKRFKDFLHTSCKFYLQALQNFEKQPEIAYLNLITAGEVLSNYFNYEDDYLFDDQMKEIISEIEHSLENGKKKANVIKSCLLQIKRRFTETIHRLMNNYFFSHSECAQENGSLKRVDFKNRIKAAYDLRSKYVHTGISFGNWIALEIAKNNEVPVGGAAVNDREFEKILNTSPTYYGLERVIRYCLLRFIHLNGIEIDSRLNDDKE